ncbi:MAG: methionine--tRNA ligase [Bacteroidales bacterium]|jgi:methionyl-tRNA synthetase|nr:methionine--tRNA ligase [Bacteroidales bacterium]MDD3100147.1 methionine--tRNA ligase [Bacteroidales bacterium]MDD3943098.1 methionine--tRNA ligase [Bacteroidales bacterium]MDD4480120.1 methionine--tRNA ligase [Bacteroidales bacterium]MDD5314315.1 methionine--tRNA ligase [Bacteroidales bacterium]
MQKEYKRYLVTSALPYANGPIHIGHLAGVYVPADIYVRYLRLRGREVCFVGGSDEHGVPITIKARQLGVSPQDIVDTYHHQIKESFSRLGISFDVYSRTTSEIHHKTASAFFRKLYDEGKFLEKETEQYFDPEANTFLADRYITGTCPRCGHADAYGDQCEKCGSTLSPDELIDPKSSISGSIPEKRKTKHWYLPLDQYEPWLREWILENHKEWKPNVYGQCKSWLDNGLQPRAVSRDLDWGVPVPVEGASGKVLYVWFDAPIGYISNTIELYPDTWEKWWKDQDTKMIHFIGKDNIVFHCIVFPSMLKAHGGYILPENVPANEFLNLEGEKISTSRNWAVWLHEYLDEFPGKEDVLRYTLCSTTPETKDNDFTWKDFQSRNNNELVAILGNFVNRAVVLTHKYFKGTVPETGTLTPYDREVLGSVSAMKNALEEHLEHYRFRDSLKEAMNIARLGNKYLADTEPWKVAKTDMERVGTILNISLQLCARLTIALEPFLPFTTKKLRDILNITKAFPWSGLDNETLLQTDHQLNEPVLLFDKIDDDAIVLQTDKLKKPVVKEVVPASPECTMDDFEKMDIRVATVLHAERVPKTDKLLKLTIDTGLDRRVIVSGIAGYYTPEEMTGKQICILANLSPRTIRGIESQGMILMAKEPDGSMRVVSPEDKIGNGAVIG